MKRVFVNAEVARAVLRESLRGVVLSELVVNARDGGVADALALSKSLGANTVVMIAVNTMSERLRAVATWADAGEVWEEGLAAGSAEEAVRVDQQSGWLLEAIQMSCLTQIFAFFDDGKRLAVRTEFRQKSRIELDMESLSRRMEVLKGVVSFQAYI